MNTQRKHFLDFLRIIACFLVIVNHTNSTIYINSNPDHPLWYISIAYFFVSKMAVPVFFMISGYLLLNKSDSWEKAFSRMTRIIIVLIACAVLYHTYDAFTSNDDILFKDWFFKILNVYKEKPSSATWYLYAYLGILLMLPFLQKLEHGMTKQDYHIFFVITGFYIGILPILRHYWPNIRTQASFYIPLFSGYIGMLLIGSYFFRFDVPRTRKGFFLALLILVASVMFNLWVTYREYQTDSSDFLFYDNVNLLPIVLEAICAFYMATFLNFKPKTGRIISNIGSCTFGIFLISDLVIKILKPRYVALSKLIHPLFAVVVFEVCVFAAGYIIISLLRKIPLFKKYL